MVKAIKAWKVVAYRARIVSYYRAVHLEKHGRVFFSNLRERYFEVRTEKALARKADSHLLAAIAMKVFAGLAASVAKNRAKLRAVKLLRVTKMTKCWSAINKYAVDRRRKESQYEQAFRDRANSSAQHSMVKLMQVGMYWLTIKGRFSSKKSRTYLAMKYGYRWLNRVRMRRWTKTKRKSPQLSLSSVADLSLTETSRSSEPSTRIAEIEHALTSFQ